MNYMFQLSEKEPEIECVWLCSKMMTKLVYLLIGQQVLKHHGKQLKKVIAY